MGGAADLPQRSSSPLKRRASDLESDVPSSSQKDDVDMINLPSSAPSDTTDKPKGHTRDQSVDMLNNGAEGDSSSSSTEQGQSTAATSMSETGM